MIRKSISIILAVMMLLSALAVLTAATASAATDFNGCVYNVDSNGIAVVTGYSQQGGSIGFVTSKIGSYSTYRIADSAFKGKSPTMLGFLGCISVGKSAFENCRNLSSITFNNALLKIGDYALRGCSRLKSIAVPAYTVIGEYALGFDDNNNKIEGFTITGYTGSYAEEYANKHGFDFISEGTVEYEDTSMYEYEVKGDATARITKYNGDQSEITIPSNIGGLLVTEIADESFMGNSTVQTAIVPSPVSKIGKRAFKDCSLVQITLPESLKSLDSEAFAGCDKMESINIPAELTEINVTAFADCGALKEIIVDSNNKRFKGNEDNTMLIEAGTKTLYRIAALTSSTYTVPDGISSIGNYAFSGDKTLESIIIPETVDNIFAYAFADCENFSEIVLPGKYLSIDRNAFIGTAWSDGVLYYNKTAFYVKGDCPEEIIIEDGAEKIAIGAFIGVEEIKSVELSNTVLEIGADAFKFCPNLESVKLGNSVQRIEEHAFFNCESMKSIIIPSSVTDIGNEAIGFHWDDGYENIIPIEDFIIYGCPDTEAQKYAEDNGFTFVEYSFEPEKILGDADGSGEVDTVDATIIQRYVTMIAVPFDEEQLMRADVDGDGDLTVVDATFIQRYATHLPTPYAISEPIA